VRRLFVAALGFVWGLLLTWLLLYVFSHVNWQREVAPMSGCSDMEHCSSRTLTLLILFGTLFWPAVVFAGINAVAYRHWPTQKWTLVFGVGSFFVVLFYTALYAMPQFGSFLK
jgi:uncharacterized membrane protein HdeD (DUF308 family)